ncbi:hypothetical protein [Sanguibacter antarcticus]|uniref:Alpha/beta hydrolase family protein n=1 Tax=Sanguibacter antarcticus TaxID=372484 RepID=A0A2A9E8J8_9MICO|nr:hypothetical protein [Sanguibacter antarcticus]PFG34976.1 hypothetical protein ATL42_2908 [Sanguibacter antarcticus]
MSSDGSDTGHATSDITRITVTGGVSPMSADTTDMAQAALLVSTAASRLASARLHCLQLAARIADIEALRWFGWGSMGDEAPGSAAMVHLDLAQSSANLAAAALALQIADLDELAASTLGAADLYSEAEASAGEQMLDVAGGLASWFVLAPVGLVATLAIGTAQSAGTSWWDRAAGGASAVLGSARLLRDPFSTPGVDDASAVLGAGYGLLAQNTGLASLRLKNLRGLPLTPQPRLDYRPGHLVETTTTVAPITSVLDAADAVADLPERSVSVLRTTHLDGTETWAVFVRGTDDWAPGSTSPFSGAANLDLLSGAPSDGMALVESALQQAGAPVGAAVGLYGHSQGGIVAMRLSDDPAFRRRYDLRSVTTFGSPVATLTQSTPVPTLHVENNQELVSSADASVSPGSTQRVTVSADLPDGHDGSAHSMGTHRQVLDAAIRSGDPAVAVAVEQQQAVLGGPAYAGSTTLPLPDVEITVFSPGAAPGPIATPPALVAPTDGPSVLTDLWAAPEPLRTPELPRTASGEIDWAEATRRSLPGNAPAQASR